MKKFLLAGFVLMSIGYAVFRLNPFSSPPPSPLPSPSPSPAGRMMGLVENEQELYSLDVEGRMYRFSWVVSKPEEVTVGINTNLDESSTGIRDDNQCQVLVNGGFYDTSSKPLGLLVNNGQELSPWRQNSLLNGVIGWNRNQGKMEVLHNAEQDDSLWWGVQAGPVLWLSGKALPLRLARDQEARRMIGGVTADNELFLAVVVAEDSLFGGPELKNLPIILAQIQQLAGISLESAINLDGGTASAFLTSGIQLKELKPIGSFMCIN